MKTKIKLLFSFFIILLLISDSNADWQQTHITNSGRVIALAANNTTIFAGALYNGVFLSTNNGTNWNQTALHYSNITALSLNTTDIYAGQIGVYKSTNNGINWVQTGLNNDMVNTLVYAGNRIFAGAENSGVQWVGGVFLSTNNGANWIFTNLRYISVYSIVVNGNQVISGTDNGIYLTTNDGVSWVQIGLNGLKVWTLSFINNNIFAGTENGVYKTTNGGISWTHSLLNRNVRALAVANNILLGGIDSNGVYLTSDFGSNWTPINEGFPYTLPTVYSITITDSYIFCGTQDSSVWRRLILEIGVKTISTDIPNAYSLFQNYPNPFNPSTQIKFELPTGTSVKLVIYDILGKEVEVIINDKLQAGTYQYEWDGSKYSSGLYFYRITTPDFASVKKMVLMK